MGFTEEEVYDIHVLLTVILNIGNAEFKSGDGGEDEDSCDIVNMAPFEDLIEMLGIIDPDTLTSALTCKFIVTGSEIFTKPLSQVRHRTPRFGPFPVHFPALYHHAHPV